MELQKYEQEHLDILRPLLPECRRTAISPLVSRERLHCMVTVCVRQ